MEEQPRHETVLDTGAEHLGRIYAEALLAAADKAGVADLVVDQLQEVVRDVLANHPNLAAAFASPRIEASEKARLIDRLFGDKLDTTLIRFLKIVAQRGRLGYLNAISSAARNMRDEALGRTLAEVRTAVPLTDELRKSIADRLGKQLQRKVVLREKVDPNVIGGIVIRVGDTVFDSSVAGRLNSLSKRTRQSFARTLMEQSARFANPSP